MTNLDRVLNSRDIALPTKVHIVKAVVFPVVMYGCESWTVKKAERQKINSSAFFMVQLSHPYITTGKTITLTRLTFVGKVMSLFLNVLSGLS